jgi:hypothetical protein
MFKNTFQSGFISIFYSVGSKPLQIWDSEGVPFGGGSCVAQHAAAAAAAAAAATLLASPSHTTHINQCAAGTCGA